MTSAPNTPPGSPVVTQVISPDDPAIATAFTCLQCLYGITHSDADCVTPSNRLPPRALFLPGKFVMTEFGVRNTRDLSDDELRRLVLFKGRGKAGMVKPKRGRPKKTAAKQ